MPNKNCGDIDYFTDLLEKKSCDSDIATISGLGGQWAECSDARRRWDECGEWVTHGKRMLGKSDHSSFQGCCQE